MTTKKNLTAADAPLNLSQGYRMERVTFPRTR